MKIIELVSWSFGLYEREAEYIDKLMDKDFPFLDIDNSEIAEYIDEVGSSRNVKHCSLCNFIIRNLFDKIVEYGTERGLDIDLFSYELNSTSSEIWYDGRKICDQDDLDRIIEENSKDEEEIE